MMRGGVHILLHEAEADGTSHCRDLKTEEQRVRGRGVNRQHKVKMGHTPAMIAGDDSAGDGSPSGAREGIPC